MLLVRGSSLAVLPEEEEEVVVVEVVHPVEEDSSQLKDVGQS